MESTTLTATLDRIEQDASGNALGVLVFDDSQQLIVPVNRLPEGCREGSVVQLHFRTDTAETERRAQRIRDIQTRLFGDRPSRRSDNTEGKP